MDKKEIKHYAAFGLTAIIVCYIIQHFALVEKAAGIALGALTPLILGAIIAYIFNIILSWFEKHYFPKTKTGFIQFSRRPVCLVISFLIASLKPSIATILKLPSSMSKSSPVSTGLLSLSEAA